ncbi:YqaA family protein [Halopseudomonas sabulinigri]|uniref:Membrane protein YqaA, SNARE-associated domain n=1 Tax=Halopseudomonas sabulinigri TaxID=472181 RepID=A0A1H1S233_9GAMM|nr:YqaA family protein [Halopseudomonas sabulinigri]SDS41856.1 membrane protein YqaA, SNARE-associated domain [Halopseudomonas sabulinigri]
MWELTSYAGLFLIALGAATVLPLQSEFALVALLLQDHYPVALLLLVATTGNVLGAILNWVLGRYLERLQHKRWFPLKPGQLHRAQAVYHRWGYWSLLMSWAPFIGDPLTIVAGLMREPLWRFTLIVTLAKGARYLLLAAATLGWMPAETVS